MAGTSSLGGIDSKPTLILHHATSPTTTTAGIIIIAIGFVIWRLSTNLTATGGRTALAGYRRWFEPTFLVRSRFIVGARRIILDAYFAFRQRMFILRRMDSDVLIIPNKYIEELRHLPENVLSPMHAHMRNVVGEHTTADIFLEGNLHTRVLQTKVTTNLTAYNVIAREELDFAFNTEVPQNQDWHEVKIGEVILRIVARISARAFVGQPLCRDERWLQTTIDYAMNLFITAFALHLVPSFLHPIARWFLPSWYKVHGNLKTAIALIVPLVERLATDEKNANENVLSWMVKMAQNESEAKPSKLAHRQLILSVASIHTTSMATTHSLYDLVANSKYIPEIVSELEQTLIEEGAWNRQALSRMWKLESFMKESQRLNPLSLISFQRMAMQDITLSDGAVIAKGTHLAVAAGPILMDPENVVEPGVFDPLRSYRQRAVPGEEKKHLLAMTDKNHLHWGHGKYACPGRFFAVDEMKMILARFLLEYEFKYPHGKGRPKNLTIGENILVDPSATLLLRRKREADMNSQIPKM